MLRLHDARKQLSKMPEQEIRLEAFYKWRYDHRQQAEADINSLAADDESTMK
jgi:hypothetical protein